MPRTALSIRSDAKKFLEEVEWYDHDRIKSPSLIRKAFQALEEAEYKLRELEEIDEPFSSNDYLFLSQIEEIRVVYFGKVENKLPDTIDFHKSLAEKYMTFAKKPIEEKEQDVTLNPRKSS